MDAGKARGASIALAAMGIVATLVGMALIQSGNAAAARLGGAPAPVDPAWVVTGGELTVLAGAALLFGAIFAFVHASRARAEHGDG